MNQNELDSEPNKQNYSFIPPEFNTHVIRLSPTTINILKNNFKYKFEKFYEKLEDIYLNWSGTLDAEFLYLLIKVGVLTGKYKNVQKFKDDLKSFYDHPGIFAWFAGSFFREGNKFISTAQFYLDNISGISNTKNNDGQLYTEVIAWKIAFSTLDTAIGLFEDNVKLFTWELPYFLIIEKLIKAKKLKLAENYINQGINRFKLKNRLVQGKLLNAKGVLTRIRGNPVKSFDYFNLALDEIKSINGFSDVFLKSYIMFNMGTSALVCRYYDEAENYFYHVLEIHKKENITDLMGKGRIYFNLTNLNIRKGEYKKALKCLTIAEDIYTELDPLLKNPVTISIYTRKSIIYRLLGDYSNAKTILLGTINKLENLGSNINPIPLIEAQYNLALLKNISGKKKEALADLRDLLHMCSSYDYIIGISRILNLISVISIDLGNIVESGEMLTEAKAIINNLTDESSRLSIYLTEAKLVLIKENLNESEAILNSVLEKSQEKEISIKSRILLGNIYLIKGEISKSNSFFHSAIKIFRNENIKTNDYYLCEFMQIKTQILLDKINSDPSDLVNNLMQKVDYLDKIYTLAPSKSIIMEYLLLKAWIYEELNDFQSVEKIYLELERYESSNDFRINFLRSIGLIKTKLLTIVNSKKKFKINNDLILKTQSIIEEIKNSSYYLLEIEAELFEVLLCLFFNQRKKAIKKLRILKTSVSNNGMNLYLKDIKNVERLLGIKIEQKKDLMSIFPMINKISQLYYSEILI
ncbi:MAG: hypothetical protein HeimC3_54760 [Candidatus Heimdallarchaeota archaeon LC_3]|nr:MAG: hypothetical protein HeimC3_54760 [Candidatus Heimdallarchaeota archaeon LC_3]